MARTGWLVQLPIIVGLNEPLFLVSPYRAHIRSAHARLRELRWLREIFLVAQPPLLCQGGVICPHEIISNWTLNSKVAHYPLGPVLHGPSDPISNQLQYELAFSLGGMRSLAATSRDLPLHHL